MSAFIDRFGRLLSSTLYPGISRHQVEIRLQRFVAPLKEANGPKQPGIQATSRGQAAPGR
jgi:hypothetical protein